MQDRDHIETLSYATKKNSRSRNWIAIVIGALTAIGPTYFLFASVTYLFVAPLILGTAVVIWGLVGDPIPVDSNRRRAKILISLVACGIAAFGPFMLMASAGRHGPSVHFVLPTGFRGGFKLVLDQVDGTDVSVQQGRITFKIPESGILRIRSFGFSEHWHTESAAFADGSTIPDQFQVGPNQLAMRAAKGCGPTRGIWYFVGSHKEWQDALSLFELPIGRVENP